MALRIPRRLTVSQKWPVVFLLYSFKKEKSCIARRLSDAKMGVIDYDKRERSNKYSWPYTD